MKKYGNLKIRSLLILAAFLLLVLAALSNPVQAMALDMLASVTPQAAVEAKVDPAVGSRLAALPAGEMSTVIVTLKNQADLTHIRANDRGARLSQVIKTLQNQANATQLHLRALLRKYQDEGQVASFESFWIFNGLAVTATAGVIDELAARPEVALIAPNEIDIRPAAQTGGPTQEPNLSVVNAPALWDLGYRGQGIVVANMDSGVDYTHPDLSGGWRGGTNSWYDPYGQHPTVPTDFAGHGTWTMGVMVGGGAGGTAIGMAPDAQWIAVKIFDDSGAATAAAIHSGFQWLLDPDGDPGTDDAPHVVNNSWSNGSGGCDLQFEPDMQALRAAGILPVFAAGNGGPNAGSSRSPADNPSAFAVGATYDSNAIYFQSSRGPSACGEPETIFPELMAPGVDIRTTDLNGFYFDYATGTSLAAPHVSGALALLLSASPGLSVVDQEGALLNGAVDLGPAGPDNDFGYGRLDVLASYQWLQEGGGTPTENLALGKPVTVSSFQDESHSGDRAVDGDAATYWQTKQVRGKKGPANEWIVVDLGSLSIVDEVIISWHDYYPTSYEIGLSNNGNDWIMAYATSGGNGGVDTVAIGGATAQYVRMNSTAWSDNSLRDWVREIEVMGISGSPTPTATPTPTPTPTPTGTPTGPGTMHVGDLEGSARAMGKNWKASVTISVHDGSEAPLANASVSGSWSGGLNDSCITDGNGQCTVSTGKIDGQVTGATFSVETLSLSGYTYQPVDNHDLDGDSDGTTFTVSQP